MKRERIVLHVDDDPAVLRFVARKLNTLGIKVISTTEPTEATKLLLESSARVALLDIDMPGLDGMTLLREIKRQDGGVQVIMLTGLVSMSTVLQSMRWGAEACVFKPITDPGRLLTALEAVFEKIDRWWLSLDELAELQRAVSGGIEGVARRETVA